MKRIDCRVLIIGAGASGIGAALGAARQGAGTVLIEKRNFPGGAAITGLHRFICGLYANGPELPKNTLNAGIAREVCSRLNARAPRNSAKSMGKVYVLPFNTQDLLTVFRGLLKREKGLELFYNTEAVSIKREGNRIARVSARGPEEIFDIKAGIVIDCSGEGIIVRLSGAKYELSPLRKRQLAGYSFRFKGLKGVDEATAIKIPYYLARGVREKKIPALLKFTTFLPGDEADEGLCKISILPRDKKGRLKQAKRDAFLVQDYLSGFLPAFKNSYITGMGLEVLEREGIRARGQYLLTVNDVLKARKFPDGAVKNAWPVEFWHQEKGPRRRYLKSGDYYEIPLRCLKARDISNLYCAGRCISVSSEALGSTRVIGTSISLGEEAGREAARRAEK